MRGGKSLLFRALAAREFERLRSRRDDSWRTNALQRRRQSCRPLMSGIVRSHVSCCPHISTCSGSRALTRVWVQRDINRTRAVAHTSNKMRFKHSVATTNAMHECDPGKRRRDRKGEGKSLSTHTHTHIYTQYIYIYIHYICIMRQSIIKLNRLPSV